MDQWLADELIEEYKRIKPRLVSGEITNNQLTTRQQAGLHLVSFRRGALAALRTMPVESRRILQERWPDLEDLLTKALAQRHHSQ